MNAPSRRSLQRLRKGLPAGLAGAVVVLLIVAVFWLLPRAGGAAVQQPIRFNHSVHTKLMTCEFCHLYYPTREVAGRPPLIRCALCHLYPMTENPEAAKILKFVEERREIPWLRLTSLPDFVHFSHQRHVVVAKVECKVCHGEIAQMTAPPAAPLVAIRMQFCLDCHQSKAVALTPRAVQTLQAADLPAELQDALPDFENKRFPTSANLVDALAQVAGTALADKQRQQIVSQVQPAPPATTDCIGCHR